METVPGFGRAFLSGHTLGLILDAAVIGLGAVMPAGILAAISPVRFIANGFLIPLLFPICVCALELKKT